MTILQRSNRLRVAALSAAIAVILLLGGNASRAQQDRNANTAAASEPTKDGLRSRAGSETSVAQPRRKRSGPESIQPDNTDATPAEGQSDLIKVLQPSQRTK